MSSDVLTLPERVALVQIPILDAARAVFTDYEVQHLRAVIRLAVEFDDFLRVTDLEAIGSYELDYLSGSVFGGVPSLVAVADAYRTSAAVRAGSELDWNNFTDLRSPQEFRDHYFAKFERFSAERSFDGKCLLLLDLFKLQLFFVAIQFKWCE
jgi:hypothetical protein